MEENNLNLSKAIKIVNEAIDAEYKRFEAISQAEEAKPVPVEGIAYTGCDCEVMVDPRKAAQIMLQFDYPVFSVLELDAPGEMWRKLSKRYGLKDIKSISL